MLIEKVQFGIKKYLYVKTYNGKVCNNLLEKLLDFSNCSNSNDNSVEYSHNIKFRLTVI